MGYSRPTDSAGQDLDSASLSIAPISRELVMPSPTPKPTAEGMAHAVCENQWGQEGVVKSERDSAARVLLPLVTKRDDEIRRQAFEEAAEHAAELARKSIGLSLAPYREACVELAGWCLDRASAKEKPDG